MLTQPLQCENDDSGKRQFIGSINRLDGKSLPGSSPVIGGFFITNSTKKRTNPEDSKKAHPPACANFRASQVCSIRPTPVQVQNADGKRTVRIKKAYPVFKYISQGSVEG